MNTISIENAVVKPFLQLPPGSKTKVLDFTINSGFTNKIIYHRQETVAERIGCHRATVNRAYGYLDRHGFIKKTYRGVKKTCLYVLSDVIIKHAHLLRHKFKALKYVWNVTDLFDLWGPATKSSIQNNFKQMLHNNNEYNINYYQEPVSSYGDCHFSETDLEIKKNNLKPEELDQILGQCVGDVMKLDIPLTKTMEEVRDTLDLNHWGEIKISPFPDEALSATLAQLKHANPRNTVKWFVDSCVQYCKENDLRIDWHTFYELRDRHKMPSNPSYIKNKTVANKSQSPRDKSPSKKFLTLEPELPKEEQDAYTTEQYMHFEIHREQPDKDVVDRKYVHPMFKDMQNPFVREYNTIREERGLEPIEIKETVSWSVFEFEV